MRGILSLLLAILLVLGSCLTGYAADDNTLTLAQAKELASKNSRNLLKYQIAMEKAKYQWDESNYDYNAAADQYNVMMQQYNDLCEEYSSLQEQLDAGDGSVVATMNEIKEEMAALEEKMYAEGDNLNALADKTTDAEDAYDDSVRELDNYKKTLDYLVEELYFSILNREANLQTLTKEYDLSQYLLNLEKTKFAMGRSSQAQIDQLSKDIMSLDKQIADLTTLIQTSKKELNDMIGRGYDEKLTLTPFTVSNTTAITEADYSALLSKANQDNDTIADLKEEVSDMKDDLENENDYYQSRLLELDIKAKELQLQDEKYAHDELVKKLIADAKTKQADYQLAVMNYQNQARTYSWDQKKFELGRLSKVSLMQSELTYLNMKDKKLAAEYALYLVQHAMTLAQSGIFVQ